MTARMPRIACLVPDLPNAAALAPYLERIDAARWYSNFGPLALELEARLTAHLAATSAQSPIHLVTCSSGTAALEAGLSAYRLPAGTRVLLPALTFPATALAVLRSGHVPVLADVCPDSWLLTPEIAEAALAENDIGLVMPVTIYGQPVSTADWDAFTKRTQIPVLVDAAPAFDEQTIGATTAVAFSFHATKPFGIGEGGAFVTARSTQAEHARSFTNFGFGVGVVESRGSNAKLSEYHAAAGLAQLDRWSEVLLRRQRVWTSYWRRLRSIDGVQLQFRRSMRAPALLTVALDRPAVPVALALEEAGIGTRRWYVPPLYEHPAFEGVALASPRLEVTAELAPRLLGLPFHTSLEDVDIGLVVSSLARALRATARRRKAAS